MWTRLRIEDLRTIVHYAGILVVGIGLAMIVPLVTAVALGEWDPAMRYVLGIGVASTVGTSMALVRTSLRQIRTSQALMIAALSWLVASLVSAVPLALADNYPTYLDAAFNALSGLTTSGLTVVVDLDHMAYADIMWRQLTHLIGGQGIIIAALSLAIGLRGGAFSLYLAEGRDEKVLPNVVNTARFIWFVTAVYLVVGTASLLSLNLVRGMEPLRAGLQAFWIAIAAYDTGGFATQSQNAGYYHSWMLEGIALTLMLAGTLNFNLHAAVWRGNRRELFRNIETRTLAVSILALSVLVGLGCAAEGLFTGPVEAVRKGLFHLLSAHSGTGFQTVYPSQWETAFGELTWFAILIAMALGGGLSSTAGGVKAFRIGLMFKTIAANVRQAVAPKSAVVVGRYHHMRTQVITPELTVAVLMFFTTYVLAYITGGIIGLMYGYPLKAAMFESISAAANVGLSMGVTEAGMPTGLKLIYMLEMWIGRLEFVAVFALVGHVIAAVRRVWRTA